MTEISKTQATIATVAGIHNASTVVLTQPTVKGAKFVGRKVKDAGGVFANRYRQAKEAKVSEFEQVNAAKPVVLTGDVVETTIAL